MAPARARPSRPQYGPVRCGMSPCANGRRSEPLCRPWAGSTRAPIATPPMPADSDGLFPGVVEFFPSAGFLPATLKDRFRRTIRGLRRTSIWLLPATDHCYPCASSDSASKLEPRPLCRCGAERPRPRSQTASCPKATSVSRVGVIMFEANRSPVVLGRSIKMPRSQGSRGRIRDEATYMRLLSVRYATPRLRLQAKGPAPLMARRASSIS
jgi:hypothetical protein